MLLKLHDQFGLCHPVQQGAHRKWCFDDEQQKIILGLILHIVYPELAKAHEVHLAHDLNGLLCISELLSGGVNWTDAK